MVYALKTKEEKRAAILGILGGKWSVHMGGASVCWIYRQWQEDLLLKADSGSMANDDGLPHSAGRSAATHPETTQDRLPAVLARNPGR